MQESQLGRRGYPAKTGGRGSIVVPPDAKRLGCSEVIAVWPTVEGSRVALTRFPSDRSRSILGGDDLHRNVHPVESIMRAFPCAGEGGGLGMLG
jgi:hypothetical protein